MSNKIFEFAMLNELQTTYSSLATFGLDRLAETIQAPYVIQNTIVKNEDIQLPCDSFGDSGEATLQWDIYHKDSEKALVLKNDLNQTIYNIDSLTFLGKIFTINSKITNSGAFTNLIENGLVSTNLTMTFNYTTEE